MPAYRLNRLFHPDSGRCIDVAVDHGFFGEVDLLAGIEDMAAAIETLVAAAPDAIQLPPGPAPGRTPPRPGQGPAAQGPPRPQAGARPAHRRDERLRARAPGRAVQPAR